MKIRVLSRKSDLAIIQAHEFGNYFKAKFPEIEIEVVGVTIDWPGASAEDVDLNVVEPLQAQLRFLEGVDELETRSRFGVASFNLSYKRGFNMSKATNDVEAAIGQITTLPKDIERPIKP